MTLADHDDRWDADVPLPEPRTNRPVTLLHRLEAVGADLLFAWSRRAGIEKASNRLGWLLRRLGPRLRKPHGRGHANLSLVMPELDAAQREEILREEWENLGRTVAEFAHLDTVGDRTTVLRAERVTELVREGRPAIFFSGHFANWEAMAIALHRLGLRYAVVYRAANNPLVDEKIIRLRAAVMSRRQIPKGKRGGRELMRAAKDGLSLCMLTDQKLGDGISVPLLGHSAMTAPAAARLALRGNLPVIPLQIVRQPGSRFTMTVHDPIEVERSGDTAADTERLTGAINGILGDFIRERPGQWLWFHRRWPSG